MNDWIQVTPLFLAVAILVPAAVVDIRDRRIPNSICITGFISGFILHGLLNGWSGLSASIGAGIVLLIGMFPFFVFGWMGAGDVKLIGAVGAIAGTLTMALAALFGILGAGVVLALLTIIHRRSARSRTHGTVRFGMPGFLARFRFEDEISAQSTPYGVAIACGAIVVMAISIL